MYIYILYYISQGIQNTSPNYCSRSHVTCKQVSDTRLLPRAIRYGRA